MAQYSTSLRTQYLNPRSHIKNRSTEFRLDANTVYQSNFRLLNVGLKKAGATGNYNPSSGVLSLIQNIRLMDGSRELSSLRQAPDYTAFKNITASNEKVSSIHDALHKSRAGLQLQDDGALHGYSTTDDSIPQDNFDDSKSGYVDLSLFLPLLSNVASFDTSMFKNLRLVIEYSNLNHYGSKNKADVLEVQEPVLCVDEIVGDKKLAAMKSQAMKTVVWSEIESDTMIIPFDQVATGGANVLNTKEQIVNAVINGFDNKYVSRVLVVKTYQDKGFNYNTTNGALGRGNLVSLAMFKDSLQVRHKGSNIFNGDALSNMGYRQMLLEETFGQITVPPFGAAEHIGDHKSSVGPVAGAGINVSGQLATIVENAVRTESRFIGQYDYIGFQIEDYVKQLQFNYSRECVQDTSTGGGSQKNNVAMQIMIYAEVRKQLSFANGKYDVSYV